MTAPFAIKGIDHIVLRVRDIEASRHFYEQILGCKPERALPDLGLFQLRAGAQLIDLVPVDSRMGGGAGVNQDTRNQDHFCLTISPFDEPALRGYFQAQGLTCSESGERYGAEGYGQSVYIRDPDGNVLEIKATRA